MKPMEGKQASEARRRILWFPVSMGLALSVLFLRLVYVQVFLGPRIRATTAGRYSAPVSREVNKPRLESVSNRATPVRNPRSQTAWPGLTKRRAKRELLRMFAVLTGDRSPK